MFKTSQLRTLVISVLVVVSLIATSLTPRAQSPRSPKPQSAQPQKPGQPASQTKRQTIALARSARARALAKAFQSGKLPDPMPLPPGNVDRQATALAKLVVTGNDSATAALYAAVLAAGFAVRQPDGTLTKTADRNQGLVFNAWELAATAKLYGEGYGVMVSHLSEAFTRSIPELKDAQLATVLLDGIRAGTRSNNPGLRFWSRFIVELGRNSQTPYDLLTQVDPAKTRLDAIQVALLLSRLAGDLAVFEKQAERNIPTINGRTNGDATRRGRHPSSLLRADRTHHSVARYGTRLSTQAPCGTSDTQDLILDYNALTSTTLFGLLANRLGGRVGSYGGKVGIANIVLTVLKFIATYALLNVELSMDGDTLVRTQDTKPGARHTLSAKLRIDTGQWQNINCLRPVLNAAGLDIDLPKDGPLSGVTASWSVVLGGDNRGWIENVSDILNGIESSGDALVFLDAMPGTDRSPGKQVTDGNGLSQIYIVGAPQKEDLSKRKLFEVNKAAGVTVGVQIKPMKIKDTQDALSNIIDIAGNAFSFLTGDAIGGSVGVLSETLYRSNWYSAQPFYFVVKDWEPCNGQWQGTITYVATLKEEGSAESFTNKQHWKNESYYEARARLDGRKDNLGAPLALVQAHASQVREMDGTGKGECYRESKQIQGISGRQSETTTGFTISVEGRTGRYRVSAPIIVVNGSGETTQTSVVKGTCRNPFNKDVTYTNPETDFKLDPEGPSLEGEGVLDPNNPDVLSGSNSITVPTLKGGERTVKITWDLTRCRDNQR
jgi:hypothetical protein